MPRSVRFIALTIVALVILQGLLRFAFFIYFHPSPIAWGPTLQAFVLGARFDLRYAILMILPWCLWITLRHTDVFSHRNNKDDKRWRLHLWSASMTIVVIAMLYVYINDAGYFAYLSSRLQANILRFLDNWHESFGMLTSTYPLKTIFAALVLIAVVLYWSLLKILARVSKEPSPPPLRWQATTLWSIAVTLLLAFGIFGKFSQYPLRWSDAYEIHDGFAPLLAQHPLQSFIDSIHYRNSKIDEKAVAMAAKRLAPWFGVEDSTLANSPLSFARYIKPHTGETKTKEKPLSVVVVLLESFSAYRSSITNNPLDPTPFLKSLSDKSVLFDRSFSARAGTASGVFATMTGIPDVELSTDTTSSRNPSAVRQNLIINAFTGYEKFYFIGGSASWGQIRGLLKANIPDLHLIEMPDYKAPALDVWGVQDTAMMQEAGERLANFHRQGKPFFAVIQTATNHRPYSFAPTDLGPGLFQLRQESTEKLNASGFTANDEFNAMRYMDYAVSRFMEQAKTLGYDKDTLFVFLGDHGITAGKSVKIPHMPPAWESIKLRLTTGHTPLIFYSPGRLKPRVIHDTAMQVDVMATIASLVGVPYWNTTIGRNLFDENRPLPHLAFTINNELPGNIGAISGRFYYRMNPNGSDGELYDLEAEKPEENSAALHPEVAAQLRQFTGDIYQASKYLTTHNPPMALPSP